MKVLKKYLTNKFLCNIYNEKICGFRFDRIVFLGEFYNNKPIYRLQKYNQYENRFQNVLTILFFQTTWVIKSYFIIEDVNSKEKDFLPPSIYDNTNINYVIISRFNEKIINYLSYYNHNKYRLLNVFGKKIILTINLIFKFNYDFPKELIDYILSFLIMADLKIEF